MILWLLVDVGADAVGVVQGEGTEGLPPALDDGAFDQPGRGVANHAVFEAFAQRLAALLSRRADHGSLGRTSLLTPDRLAGEATCAPRPVAETAPRRGMPS